MEFLKGCPTRPALKGVVVGGALCPPAVSGCSDRGDAHAQLWEAVWGRVVYN